MNISKILTNNERYELFINDEKGGFKIHFGGADLYWTLEDYYEDNEFIVTESDKEVYNHLRNLFNKIKKYDNKYSPTLRNGVFEWISEAREPEISNRLLIIDKDQKFIIKFIQNPLDIYNIRGMCAVCFCLSGSRNQSIAHEFSRMYISYHTNSPTNQKCLKKPASNGSKLCN